MIHRIVFPLIMAIVLSDLYIDMHYFRKHYHIKRWQRVLWWTPAIIMVIYTCLLATIRNFAPSDLTWLNLYLLLIGLFVGPKAVFTVFSSIGWVLRKTIIPTHRNYGHYVGLVAGVIAVGAYIYGLTFGIQRIKVNHVDLYFSDLPKSFDGYRVMHVSDLHLGTFDGWRSIILKAEMDSIRAHKTDIICFTGDIENMRPQEVEKLQHIIAPAMIGTISVLGNHDYAEYVKHTPELEASMLKRLLTLEQDSLGWTTLENRSITLRRGNDSIMVVGTENDGRPPFPQKADWRKAFKGVGKGAFVIALQHDPSAWEREILPNTDAQLTLSGHTHGGQMQILGYRPTQMSQRNDLGLYSHNGRYMYVNAGLGGLVPFRLNMPNEITVITLHRKANQH